MNEKILKGKQELENTHVKLVDLNQILEHKVIERTERLTSSEHKCRRIFEQSLDTIILTDGEFKIMEINPAGIELTGFTKDEMVMGQMTVGGFFLYASDWGRLCGVLKSKEYVLNEEVEFIRPDKTRVLVLITGGIDYGAFGCAKTFHFIIKNINEKKQMERQIVQADKLAALGELSAGVAHEINNPLGVILGYTQLMLNEKSPFRSDLKIIEKHVKNCKTVVSDLLSFSRKGSLEKTVVDINRVVDNVIKFLSNHSDFRDIEIILKPFTREKIAVLGSEQELSQVVMNLMINAGHAVDKKGVIEIRTLKKDGRTAVLTIRDNGVGIHEKNLNRIFDPFFTTKPVGQGTGLGLSVGYGIIKRHGGEIAVESKAGEGARFAVTLPTAG